MGISDIVSIIGALGIGSFVGQYLIGSQQRRQVRGQVLHALENVEFSRWAGSEPRTPGFNQAMRELETAALIARVPRGAIVHYKVLATAGMWLSQQSFDEYPDPEYGGGIESAFANHIRAAAGEVSRLVWSPWMGRVGLTRRIAVREAMVEGHEEASVTKTVQRAREYVV